MADSGSTEIIQSLQTPVWRGDLVSGSSNLFAGLQTFQDLLSQVQGILDAIVTVLDAIKAFIPGLLDPLALLIETLIEELADLIQGLLNIGVYVTFDNLNQLNTLKGGYTAFEERIVRKLLNPDDPSAPKAETSSLMLVGYLSTSLYRNALSIDISQETLQKLLNAARIVKNFFKKDDTDSGDVDRSLGRVASLAVEYAPASTPVSTGTFKSLIELQGQKISTARIAWSLDKQGLVTLTSTNPNGFIIEISASKNPYLLVRSSVSRNETAKDNPQTQVTGVEVVVDPYTNESVQITGGLDVTDYAAYNPKSYETDYYLAPLAGDGTTIPYVAGSSGVLKAPLKNGDDYLLMRSYFVPTRTSDKFQTNYRFTITPDMLPFEATVDSNQSLTKGTRLTSVYVRVRPVRVEKPETKPTKFYSLVGPDFKKAAGFLSVGTPSEPVLITFPPDQTVYQKILKSAFAIIFLSAATDNSIAAMPEGLQKYYDLAGTQAPEEFTAYKNLISATSTTNTNPSAFYKAVLALCDKMTSKFLQTTASNLSSVQDIIIRNGQVLLEWQMSDSNVFTEGGTILDILQSNPVIRTQTDLAAIFPNKDSYVYVEQGSKGDLEVKSGILQGVPVYVGKANYRGQTFLTFMLPLRQVFPTSLYAAVLNTLNLTATTLAKKNPQTKQWYSLNLMQLIGKNAQLPTFEQDLNALVSVTLANFARFSSSVTARLEEFISQIEARVLELQKILDFIDSLTQVFSASFQLSLPFLATITQPGVNGLVSAITGAQNKPLDSAIDYSFGIAAVIPLPLSATLRQLLFTLFGGGEESAP